ncbi:MAG: peptidase S41, partial [Blastomonas fulva]|nr:peptidase S41 [Blastomonas fulva]
MRHITGLLASCALLLSACGGGGGSSPTPGPTAVAGAPTATPAPSPTCSLENRQAFARDVLNEWYLF